VTERVPLHGEQPRRSSNRAPSDALSSAVIPAQRTVPESTGPPAESPGVARETNKQVGPSSLCVNPIFEIGPLEPRYSEYLVFEGISVDEAGKQHFLDASLAYKRAVLNAIKYLANFGYTEEQVRLHP
jgi:hypothetical protein